MKYQIIEKALYSEADLIHFGENYELGEIANEQFPDYSGVPLGNAIFESEDIEEIEEKKKQFEIKRLKIAPINCFLDDDESAEKFLDSQNFIELIKFYENEFELELSRRIGNNIVVENDDFFIPSFAKDEQVLRVQELLGIYFFEIRQES